MDAIKPESWKGSRKDHPKSEEEIEKKRPKNIKKYSKKWSSFISAVLKSYDNHNPERRLLVKYEDLRKDTFSELKKIYDFIGIKITEEDLKKKIKESAYENVPQSEKGPGKKIRTANPGSYVENFSADEIDLMNSIMGDTLKKVGYSI
jgi:hypothetical protein